MAFVRLEEARGSPRASPLKSGFRDHPSLLCFKHHLVMQAHHVQEFSAPSSGNVGHHHCNLAIFPDAVKSYHSDTLNNEP